MNHRGTEGTEKRSKANKNDFLMPYSFCLLCVSVPLWLGPVSLHDLGEDVALAHDLDFLAVDLDVAATVAAEDHLVALDDGERSPLAVVAQFARPDRQDAATL